jgi:hypothetical protein
MSMTVKTVVPAVYSRVPGGVPTPAAALHSIIEELGSATPWVMLAFCLAPSPARVKTVSRAGQPFHDGPLSRRETMPGGETSPRLPPPSVPRVETHESQAAETRLREDHGEAAQPGLHEDAVSLPRPASFPATSPARIFAKKSAPPDYSVRYETAPLAPDVALTAGGRG